MLPAAKQPQNIAGISNNVNKELVFTNSWEIPVESLQIMVRVDRWFWPETNIDLTVSFRLKEGEGVGGSSEPGNKQISLISAVISNPLLGLMQASLFYVIFP